MQYTFNTIFTTSWFLPYNAVPMLSCSVVLLELDNKIVNIKGTPNVISSDP